MSTFRYEPLDDSPDAMRVLEVEPDLLDGKISVTLRHERLPTRYRCLSYVWGEDPSDHEILLNGEPIRIRRNLFEFLCTARKYRWGQPLWIDALCINQEDHIERGHQVRQMGRIYQGAIEVLIWLGPQPGLEAFFDLCHKGQQYSHLLPHEAWLSYSIGINTAISDLLQSQSHVMDTALVLLSGHPYWSRTWIAQEVLLARALRVLIGTREMEWQRLIRAIEAYMKYSETSSAKPFRQKFAPMKFHVERQTRVQDSYDSAAGEVWKLLTWLGDTNCLDSRDRIYALLALVRSRKPDLVPFETDYNEHRFALFDAIRRRNHDIDSFEVDYREDPLALFWRTGEHFQAWDSLQYISILYHACGPVDPLYIDALTRYMLPSVSLTGFDLTRSRHTLREYDLQDCSQCYRDIETEIGNTESVVLVCKRSEIIFFNAYAILRSDARGSFSTEIVSHYGNGGSRPIQSHLKHSYGPGVCEIALRSTLSEDWMPLRVFPPRKVWEDYRDLGSFVRVSVPGTYVLDCLRYIFSLSSQVREGTDYTHHSQIEE
ncbi:heterokaryon incompatibility protein-domain-containing protein [Lophiotrema nucula]|uniref:Heterokaryon incompatibility protein-domain-containing protein n=1 Tax=Lophiotrema nucula TaxID=690887 RepID=A0A6A5Z728_9PLEO|nr:heterokaryon incompatibility protein-domain-containing protein [Lophiotrema nucula]